MYITGGPGGGGLQNLELHNWYLESNGTAIKADPNYVHQRINISNSWFHNNDVHLDGPTIISGGIDRSCVIVDTQSHIGSIIMNGNDAGRNGFILDINESINTTNVKIPTIPTKYSLGPNVRASRVVTLSNSSYVPYARNKEETSITPQKYSGSTIGAIPDNTVPFCDVLASHNSATIYTQFVMNEFEMWAYNLLIVDSTGAWKCQGIIAGFTVIPANGQKDVTIGTTSSGKMQITISGGLSGITNIKGVVKAI